MLAAICVAAFFERTFWLTKRRFSLAGGWSGLGTRLILCTYLFDVIRSHIRMVLARYRVKAALRHTYVISAYMMINDCALCARVRPATMMYQTCGCSAEKKQCHCRGKSSVN